MSLDTTHLRTTPLWSTSFENLILKCWYFNAFLHKSFRFRRTLEWTKSYKNLTRNCWKLKTCSSQIVHQNDQSRIWYQNGENAKPSFQNFTLKSWHTHSCHLGTTIEWTKHVPHNSFHFRVTDYSNIWYKILMI